MKKNMITSLIIGKDLLEVEASAASIMLVKAGKRRKGKEGSSTSSI